jgi:hypothetical protein
MLIKFLKEYDVYNHGGYLGFRERSNKVVEQDMPDMILLAMKNFIE